MKYRRPIVIKKSSELNIAKKVDTELVYDRMQAVTKKANGFVVGRLKKSKLNLVSDIAETIKKTEPVNTEICIESIVKLVREVTTSIKKLSGFNVIANIKTGMNTRNITWW